MNSIRSYLNINMQLIIYNPVYKSISEHEYYNS